MSVLGAWLTATLFAGRLVAYNPRLYDPNAGIAPSARSIVADARMLRRLGFRTVTTYGSGTM